MTSSIPGSLLIRVIPTGWELIQYWVRTNKSFVSWVYRNGLKSVYSNRSWPDKPVVVELPNGRRFHVTGNGDVREWFLIEATTP